jgi:type IV pilus assembly protein PilA
VLENADRSPVFRSSRITDNRGFTLIELLVVLLIMGILVAIALPSFLTQRAKAQDGDAKSAASTAATALESYATESDNGYSDATTAKLAAIEPTLSDLGSRLSVSGTSHDGYTVSVLSTSTYGTAFSVTRVSNGTVEHTCSPGSAGKGGCRDDGTW